MPIEGSVYGPALREDGSFDAVVAYLNFQWELNELEKRLEQASFCGHSISVYQAASMHGCRSPCARKEVAEEEEAPGEEEAPAVDADIDP